MKKNTDSPAFPSTVRDNNGLTKREYFAAIILQGLCAGRTESEPPGAEVAMAVELADLLLMHLD